MVKKKKSQNMTVLHTKRVIMRNVRGGSRICWKGIQIYKGGFHLLILPDWYFFLIFLKILHENALILSRRRGLVCIFVVRKPPKTSFLVLRPIYHMQIRRCFFCLFLISYQKICCQCLKEPSHWDGSFKYSQHICFMGESSKVPKS